MDRDVHQAPILKTDLKKLARIASEEREDFFGRHPEWALLYRKRWLCSALCREAAVHFTNGSSGFREFDVWNFYAEHPEAAFPHHLLSYRDFGKSRFGRDAGAESYAGRRVVVTGRSLACAPGADPVEALQLYLRRGETPSARELRLKAVVLLEPERYLGYIAWPTLVVATG